MKIYCHPVNAHKLREQIERDRRHMGLRSFAAIPSWTFFGMEIVEDPSIPIDRPTGKYVLPGGEVVDREHVRVKTRWVSYGPEDLDWLIYAGLVKDERELVYQKFNDFEFTVRSNFGTVISQPRGLLYRGSA